MTGATATTEQPTIELNAEAFADSLAEQLLPRVGEAVDERMGPYREQIAAQVQERLTEMGLVDDTGAVIRPPTEADQRHSLEASIDPTAHNPRAIGASLDGRFESFADYMRAVAISGQRKGTDERLQFISDSGDIKADLSGSELATGGALVPEEFRAQLMQIGLQESSIRRRCTQIPLGSSKMRLPALRDTDHSGNTVFGGVRAYWTKPGQAITESEPSFMERVLDASGLKILTDIENELMSDSFISAEAFLVQMWSQAIPWFEEQAFLNGDGVGQPLGITNSAARIGVSRATSNEVNIADLANMEARMLPSSLGRAVWVFSPQVLPQLTQLESTGGAQVLVRNLGTDNVRAVGSVLGYPFIINEHAATLGSANDIMFVDWNFYLIGDRQALSIASSPHAKFAEDITVFRGVERLDAMPWVDSPITPANGGDTLSPIVGLDA